MKVYRTVILIQISHMFKDLRKANKKNEYQRLEHEQKITQIQLMSLTG